MHDHISQTTHETQPPLDDNARKFVMQEFDPATYADKKDSVTVFRLITDWLIIDEESETKLVHKQFSDGTIHTLRIVKQTDASGKRTSTKTPITLDEYTAQLSGSVRRVEKVRHEFTYTQAGRTFSMKYDDFGEAGLKILEVDAEEGSKDREVFEPKDFPVVLSEVTGDMSYYGSRIAEHI